MNKTTTAREFIRRQTLGNFRSLRALLGSKVTSSAVDMGGIGHNFEKAAVWREDPLSVSFVLAAEVQHIPFLPLRGGTKPAR